MSTFGIGQAVKEMRDGKRLARQGWNGKGMYLELQVPDAHSKMTLPYVFMRTAQGDLVPWLCSQTDLLAVDWQVVEGGSTKVASGGLIPSASSAWTEVKQPAERDPAPPAGSKVPT